MVKSGALSPSVSMEDSMIFPFLSVFPEIFSGLLPEWFPEVGI
jgi:hypothetical protein